MNGDMDKNEMKAQSEWEQTKKHNMDEEEAYT